jgi:DNA-binding MarR family transcriptional regulator
MPSFDTVSIPMPRRLLDGIDRLSLALKVDQISSSAAAGLNPAQAHVLGFLAGRAAGGARVKAIARHLGVTQPTATDSIAALARKGMVTKSSDGDDARAVMVAVTEPGRRALKAIESTSKAMGDALGALDPDEQEDLLILIVKLIRSLQVAGAISDQRMCASCSYFRPHAYPGAEAPHHCAFVNAAFGSRQLRLDCSDHQTAETSLQNTNWRTFTDPESASPSANA